MNIFDLLESPGMGRPRDTNGIQSAADQSACLFRQYVLWKGGSR